MIKLFKSQVQKLRDIVNKFDEVPVNHNIYVCRVDELKRTLMGTGVDAKYVYQKESEAPVKGGTYPLYAGVVVAVSAEIPFVTVGDLVRFTPMQGEEFTTSDMKTQILRGHKEDIRGKSVNIFQYEGEEDPINPVRVEEPAPTEDEDIPAVVYRSQGNDVN